MRAFVIAATFMAAMAGQALAADLPWKAPVGPIAPAGPEWSGFYLGLNAGGGFATGRSDFSVPGGVFATVNNPLTGAVGGVQAGWLGQSGSLVYGLEADFQAADLDGSISAPCGAGLCGIGLTANYRQRVPWFGTVRGRLGYAASRWLIYATGGYAYAQVDTEAKATAPGVTATVRADDFRSGWTIGGGIEVAFAPGWSARLEYLYVDLGTQRTNFIFTGLPVIADDARLDMSVVRAGVNFRF
jgi:outer membrane immunogenic protein